MRSNTRRDTKPERALRSALFKLGLRYRIDSRPLPHVNRRADIVFRPVKVAIFMHGCFWHGCPDHCVLPTRNAAFWTDKIQRNKQRDRETLQFLEQAEWIAVTVWEHDDLEAAASEIAQLVTGRRDMQRRQ